MHAASSLDEHFASRYPPTDKLHLLNAASYVLYLCWLNNDLSNFNLNYT
jgi:hypothetical protein